MPGCSGCLQGGIDEMQLTDGKSTDTKLVIADRKGYAKLAIETGCDLVPGFCFGEKWVHKSYQLPLPVRKFLYKVLRVSGTMLKGRGLTFLGYLDHPLGFVWGEPIRVQQQTTVDPAYLDEVHSKMQQAIRSIFDRYKQHFCYGEEETLTFVTVDEARNVNKITKQQ